MAKSKVHQHQIFTNARFDEAALDAERIFTLPNYAGTPAVLDSTGVLYDANGNELVQFEKVTSAVDFLKIVNADTTTKTPFIEAVGDDSVVNIGLMPKGVGSLVALLNRTNPGVTSHGNYFGIIDSQGNPELILSSYNDFRMQLWKSGGSFNVYGGLHTFSAYTGAASYSFDQYINLAFQPVNVAQITADQNNYAGFTGKGHILRAYTDASRTLTGCTAGINGEWHFGWNIGSFDLVFAHQSGSSTDVNRFITTSGANLTIAPNEGWMQWYDTATERWRVQPFKVGAGGGGTAASTTEVLTGTDTSKFATPDAIAALWEQGSDVASASAISLGEGGYFFITGTTTITDIDFATDKSGRPAWVKFSGALTLTHNASTLILPTGANITTAAGDTACFVSEGSDAVRCVAYQRADGKALASHITDGDKGDIVVASSGASLKVEMDIVTLTDAATVSITAAGNHHFLLSTASSRTIGNPGAGYNGQVITIRWKNTSGGNITTALTTGAQYAFRYPTGITALEPTPTGETDYIVAVYHSTDERWDVIGFSRRRANGYAINVQALTSSPADAATIYFGTLPKAPTTTANISKVYIRRAGTIRLAEIYCYSGTAGTNESWSIYIRLNNTTDTLIATVSAATSERVFSNTSLSIAVAAGDYIEIKSVNPTWATNPLTTIFGGYIWIEEV